MPSKIILGVILSLSIVCNSQPESNLKIINNKEVISHSIWNSLLQKHVDNTGKVNYKGFIEDKVLLEEYTSFLLHNKAKTSLPDAHQISYWINVYNAFTIKLIVDNYPVKSIKDIKSGIPFINSVWDLKIIDFGDEQLSLNNVEHKILRNQFNEPRIHFAVNCASYSCPKLYNQAFIPEKLDEQLTFLARDFIADERKNIVSDPENIRLSKIFSWYRFDFKRNNKSVIDYINQYAPNKIDKNAEIKYMDYNWSLNE